VLAHAIDDLELPAVEKIVEESQEDPFEDPRHPAAPKSLTVGLKPGRPERFSCEMIPRGAGPSRRRPLEGKGESQWVLDSTRFLVSRS
jgi:hypothetical protein